MADEKKEEKTLEEAFSELDVLAGKLEESSLIRNSEVLVDGFTGFTPTQYDLLEKMMRLCSRVIVTVTTDETGKRGSVFEIADTTMRLSLIHISEPTRH